MKHTKGPWVAIEYGGYWNIQKEDAYSNTYDLLNEEKCPDAEANAKLAAAAPELLQVLISTSQLNLHLYEAGTVGNVIYNKIQSIIKKATS